MTDSLVLIFSLLGVEQVQKYESQIYSIRTQSFLFILITECYMKRHMYTKLESVILYLPELWNVKQMMHSNDQYE